ncbi:uncharacterized protein LOC111945164, partial [Cyanistes caeruleus]|uniref:uncharacterized protein LOC111945164 n=1 Tax=Cyanistes caeruleus TaxID=156563 RepID=UPI000CDB6E95
GRGGQGHWAGIPVSLGHPWHHKHTLSSLFLLTGEGTSTLGENFFHEFPQKKRHQPHTSINADKPGAVTNISQRRWKSPLWLQHNPSRWQKESPQFCSGLTRLGRCKHLLFLSLLFAKSQHGSAQPPRVNPPAHSPAPRAVNCPGALGHERPLSFDFSRLNTECPDTRYVCKDCELYVPESRRCFSSTSQVSKIAHQPLCSPLPQRNGRCESEFALHVPKHDRCNLFAATGSVISSAPAAALCALPVRVFPLRGSGSAFPVHGRSQTP